MESLFTWPVSEEIKKLQQLEKTHRDLYDSMDKAKKEFKEKYGIDYDYLMIAVKRAKLSE